MTGIDGDSDADGTVDAGEWGVSIKDSSLNNSSSSVDSRRLASMIGLAVGDALGTTNEFRAPGCFTPIADMVGGGPFGLPAGAWTDDTSMALCLAESLVECAGFDARDQMTRYLRWWHDGHWSSTGECFDIGITTRAALVRFEQSGDPIAGDTSPDSAGNGSVMRLAPVVAFYAADPELAVTMARESSRLTHGAAECIDGCDILARMLLRGYRGEDITRPLDPAPGWSRGLHEVAAMSAAIGESPPYRATGYVVHTLACARWCVARGRDFREAVLLAANLGDDADTVAAVTGQLAGSRWGMQGIPAEWVERLARREEIVRVLRRCVASTRARARLALISTDSDARDWAHVLHKEVSGTPTASTASRDRVQQHDAPMPRIVGESDVR